MIEIIIAISLIGLFIALPILSYSTYMRKSRDIKRKNDINQMTTALQQFKNSQGTYPASTNGVIATDLQTLVNRGYIPSIPIDPKDGNLPTCSTTTNYCYTYSASADGLNYSLNARLEDGSGNTYYQSTPVGATVITSNVTGGPLTNTPIPSNTPLPSNSPIPSTTPSLTRTPTPSRTLTPTPSTPPPTTWSRQFGGTTSEGVFSMRYTADNGYLLAGYTNNNTAGGVDMMIMKLNANTTTVDWKKNIGGTGTERGYAETTSDGGSIMIGQTTSFGVSDFFIVKLSSTGTIEWSRTVGGASSTETPYRVQQTSDGGYIVVGTTNGFGVPTSGTYLVKLTSAGVVSWTRVLTASVEQAGLAVTQTSDGGYVIGGYSGSGTARDALIIKTDSTGVVTWERTLGVAAIVDAAYSILQTDDNNGIVISGVSQGATVDVLLGKLDMNGNIVFRRLYDTGAADYGYDLLQTSDGGFIVSGSTYVTSTTRGYLLKVDSAGGHQWSKAYNGSTSSTLFRSVRQLSDGSYIAGGENIDASGYSHFYAVKTSSNGSITGCSEVANLTAPTSTTAGITSIPVPTSITSGSVTGIPTPVENTGGSLTQRCN